VNNMEVNQVLAQMRVMAAAASDTSSNKEIGGATGVDFSTLMNESIQQVSEAQMQAGELAKSFELGDKSVGLPEVMVALQKANISFQAMTQVRNKLLNAYQEVMNMQV